METVTISLLDGTNLVLQGRFPPLSISVSTNAIQVNDSNGNTIGVVPLSQIKSLVTDLEGKE